MRLNDDGKIAVPTALSPGIGEIIAAHCAYISTGA